MNDYQDTTDFLKSTDEDNNLNDSVIEENQKEDNLEKETPALNPYDYPELSGDKHNEDPYQIIENSPTENSNEDDEIIPPWEGEDQFTSENNIETEQKPNLTEEIKTTNTQKYAKVSSLDNPLKKEKKLNIKESSIEEIQDYSIGTLTVPNYSVRDMVVKFRELPLEEQINYIEDEDKNKRIAVDDLTRHLLRESINISPRDCFEGTVTDNSRDFVQDIIFEKDGKKFRLGLSKPSIGTKSKNKELTGAEAVMRIQSIMGHTSLIKIPLWHSGFWVTLKAPLDSQLLYFEDQFLDDKKKFGYMTNGCIFTSEDFLLNKQLLNLFKSLIYKSPIDGIDLTNLDELCDLIKIQDLQIIAWGIASLMWPKGFDYTRGTIDDNNGELSPSISKGLLDLSKLMFVDKTSLSESQLEHMTSHAAINKSLTKEEVIKYQNNFKRKLSKEIVFEKTRNEEDNTSNEIRIVLEAPNINKYFEYSNFLLEKSITDVNNSLMYNEDSLSRESLIINVCYARLVGLWSHYIKEIKLVTNIKDDNYVNDDSEPQVDKYTDIKTISAWVDRVSSDNYLRDKFLEEIKKFVDGSTNAIIAVPSCSEEDENNPLNPNFPHLVPINATMLFFILRAQKLSKFQVN